MSCRPACVRPLIVVLVAIGLVGGGCSAERPILEEEAGASRSVIAEDAPPITTSAAPSTLRLAIGSDWTGDPADVGPAAVGVRVVAGLLYEGLTAVASDGTAVPGLAERWFVSNDRLQWTFVLPDDLVDGDGAPLTARDAKASFERLAARGPDDHAVSRLSVIDGWDAFVAGDAGGAAGIMALDDTTLVIRLQSVFEPLPYLLAEPTYGISGGSADASARTTGAYRMTDDPSWLEAVDADATIARIELVRSDGNGAALLSANRVDWSVLTDTESLEELPGDILRQPLDLRVGVAVRFRDPAVRRAVLAVLDPVLLAEAVPHGTLDVSGTVIASPDSLPGTVVVHAPAGDLEPIAEEIIAQLTQAGVDASLVVLGAADFAAAVASGDASVFPMLSAGGSWAQSASVALAESDGIDDVFGVVSDERASLLAAIRAEQDLASRSSLMNAVELLMLEDGLLLPVATYEVRVGVSDAMHPLRVLADGTLDLSGFDR